MKAVVVVLVVMLAGCSCQLSGTPLDTMEAKLNPACWSLRDDAPAPPPPPAE
ncbi:MAG TPA: hypothetical protein VGR62_21280 [Candidatus Binatia bacterium]|nr:hypothetical protein [Candidatus Binatia bacterium]